MSTNTETKRPDSVYFCVTASSLKDFVKQYKEACRLDKNNSGVVLFHAPLCEARLDSGSSAQLQFINSEVHS